MCESLPAMKIRPATRVFDPKTGREVIPSLAALDKSAPSPALVAGLQSRDPGFTRLVGIIPGEVITATGEPVSVALVETGDYDGAEWLEWDAISIPAIEKIGEVALAAAEKYAAEAPAREAAIAEFISRPAVAAEPSTGGSYRQQGDPRHPDKYDGQKAAREWAEDAYRSGDSWSDD